MCCTAAAVGFVDSVPYFCIVMLCHSLELHPKLSWLLHCMIYGRNGWKGCWELAICCTSVAPGLWSQKMLRKFDTATFRWFFAPNATQRRKSLPSDHEGRLVVAEASVLSVLQPDTQQGGIEEGYTQMAAFQHFSQSAMSGKLRRMSTSNN